MNEMIERVAEAIRDSDSYQDYKDYKGYARAAIEAMREPTDKMCYAGLALDTPRLTYQAMIDEALK